MASVELEVEGTAGLIFEVADSVAAPGQRGLFVRKRPAGKPSPQMWGREEGGNGVAVGDRVGWKSWSDDIPYGAVGTVTGFETDGPSGGQRTVILFDGGVGSFSIETDDGEWCRKLSGLGVGLGWEVDFQAIDFRRPPTNQSTTPPPCKLTPQLSFTSFTQFSRASRDALRGGEHVRLR